MDATVLAEMMCKRMQTKPPPVHVRLEGGPAHGYQLTVESYVDRIVVPVSVVYMLGVSEVAYRPTGRRTSDGSRQLWVPEGYCRTKK